MLLDFCANSTAMECGYCKKKMGKKLERRSINLKVKTQHETQKEVRV